MTESSEFRFENSFKQLAFCTNYTKVIIHRVLKKKPHKILGKEDNIDKRHFHMRNYDFVEKFGGFH